MTEVMGNGIGSQMPSVCDGTLILEFPGIFKANKLA